MTNEQTLVAFLLGAFGFALISAAAVIALTHGLRNNKTIIGGIVGTVLLAASFFWSHLASALDARLVAAIGAIASNFWIWLTVLFSFWAYLAVVSLMSLHQRNQYGEIIRRDLNPFRLVLQKLVIPRSLTAGQIETIGSYLSTFSPHPVTLRVNKHDKEAMYYSGFIQKALQRGGWRIAAIEYNPDLNEGLGYEGAYTQATQQRREDPREPKPHQLLVDAFEKANVQLSGGGTKSVDAGVTQDQISIDIGPRWLDLKAWPQPWPTEFT